MAAICPGLNVFKFPDVLGQISFPSATLCMEWVGVTIEARFEWALCQTVVLFVRFIWPRDCGLVHDGQAVSTEGAFAGLSAIVCAWSFVWDWGKDSGIVAADDSCHVAHTAIAEFMV